MYGLIQASRQFYKKMTNYLMKDLGFEKCGKDNCLLKKDEVILGLYVDYILMIGDNEQMEKLI